MDLITLIKQISGCFSSIAEKIEYRKYSPEILVYRDCFETIRVLTRFITPKRLCDIGANNGDWSFVLKQLAPELKHVVFFEPQAECVRKLHALALPGVTKVVYNCGLGAEEAVMTLRGGTASASFLEAEMAQTAYFPGSINAEIEEAPVKLLDEVYAKDGLPYPEVVKMDVQGYELNVLKGGLEILRHAKYLVVELSFREFYKGQPPLWEVLRFLDEHKYVMVARGYEWRNPQKPEELLQMDGIFMNTRSAKDMQE